MICNYLNPKMTFITYYYFQLTIWNRYKIIIIIIIRINYSQLFPLHSVSDKYFGNFSNLFSFNSYYFNREKKRKSM